MISRADIEECIQSLESKRSSFGNRRSDKLAICYLKIDEYSKARRLFIEACQAMLQPAQRRQDITYSVRLVEACILSGELGLYRDVEDWLTTNRLTRPKIEAYSPVACYSYAVMDLLNKPGKDITGYIQTLLKDQKLKGMYAIGLAVQAVVSKDQTALTASLSELCKVHERQVKQGGLRLAGLDYQILCTYAMSIAYVAIKYGLQVEVKSDYFSIGYLDYIQ